MIIRNEELGIKGKPSAFELYDDTDNISACNSAIELRALFFTVLCHRIYF